MSSDPEGQKKLQSLSDTYQKIQTDLQTHTSTLSRLNAQLHESESVSAEIQKLDADAPVYKQVGPCLLKQDRSEAEQAVSARLEFIKGDIDRVEKLIETLQKEGEGKKMEVFELQTRLQQGGQQQQNGETAVGAGAGAGQKGSVGVKRGG